MWRGLAVMMSICVVSIDSRCKVDIEGEISVDLCLPKTTATIEPFTTRKEEVKILRAKPPDNVTVATPIECIYQYPETKQLEALLSDMMNQLTKMFVRVHRYMTSRAVRRQVAGGSGKRFETVGAKKTDFFDGIYHNMTEEYRRFFNEKRATALHSTDPCRHQDEIRDLWRSLLNTSQSTLQRAAMQCVEEYLRGRTVADSTRYRALTMVLTELSKVRSDQLALLCDKFQLCYNDLV